MSSAIEKVSLSFIRYANCWEDADVLLTGLMIEPNSRILSVGSAGDNSLSLLTTRPSLLVVADYSLVQLHLIRLKIACIQTLAYPQALGFLGFTSCENRIQLFEKIKRVLPESSCNYWLQHAHQWQASIIHQGKFERYFQFFSKYVLPLIHGAAMRTTLVEKKSEHAQKQFYHKHWNNWRWRALFRVFFSRFVLGRFGRDPEFMKEVQGGVGGQIFKKAEQHLQTVFAQNNYLLHYIMNASFGSMLPHYMQEQHFETVKNNIDKVKLVHSTVEEAIEKAEEFDCMNLSNIFEYMDELKTQATAKKLSAGLKSGGRVAYWNLMVPRNLASILPNSFSKLEALSTELSTQDRGFFYRSFNIDVKK